MSRWESVIGLEVHVQLATASKAFSASAVRFGAEPNSLTDPTVLGLPGALPVFNQTALEHAVRLGLALGCTIRERSRFARKHYFYPDLPKGYQISQFDEPLCEGGAVEFFLDGAPHRVPLVRIHLEEDAGKSTHLGRGRSLVDLNRAGVPLCEIVSGPDLRSPAEAGEYMRALRQLVRYLGISEGDMEKGQLRCDANVSIRPADSHELGTRTELKNINSFRFVEQAIASEIERQIAIVEGGGEVVQETRLWDADAGASRSMRGKEEANDYRYFPDPDLPVLVVDEPLRARLGAELPELPVAVRRRFEEEFGLSATDAANLSGERAMADYFDATVAAASKAGGERAAVAKMASNWIQSELLRELKAADAEIGGCPVSPAALAELIALISSDAISGKIGKKIFAEMFETGEGAQAIVDREGLAQITDRAALEAVVDKVLADNAAQVEQYRAGKANLLGFFVGRVMKATRGQANPSLVNEILRDRLGAP